jgi:hypothetical protein
MQVSFYCRIFSFCSFKRPTRSADEPMTTFVSCTICLNRWSASCDVGEQVLTIFRVLLMEIAQFFGFGLLTAPNRCRAAICTLYGVLIALGRKSVGTDFLAK